MIPDINIKARKFGGPSWRQCIHTLYDNTINIVVKNCPWISFISRVNSIYEFGRSKRSTSRILYVIYEFKLKSNIGMCTGTFNMTAYQYIPIHFVYFLYL